MNKRHHIIGTGYNGVAAGLVHCIEKPCSGAMLPSGEGLDKCEAIHAEANAIMQCKDVFDIHTAFCTTAPCVHCVKLLMNTGCKRIIFFEDYPMAEESKKLWQSTRGRDWLRYSWKK
jgi:dCMP deaminase